MSTEIKLSSKQDALNWQTAVENLNTQLNTLLKQVAQVVAEIKAETGDVFGDAFWDFSAKLTTSFNKLLSAVLELVNAIGAVIKEFDNFVTTTLDAIEAAAAKIANAF